jgi:formylglycine-generating enzyme required for sulfatase activity
MEYVEGESLHDLLAREVKLSPARALELMSAIAAGVGAAHHQGIVHRDLKPLNIMICKGKTNMSEAVKILDFGLAKIKSGELLGSFIQAQTTGLMGSPYYMAPEQWADEEPDARSDVYSLGVMLYQMLAGDVPFKGSSIPAIMKKHLSDPMPPFSNFEVAVPPQIETVVRHALEKDHAKRTASVENLIEEFNAAVGGNTQNFQTGSFNTSRSLPLSNVSILTNPPQAKVFVDNVAIGESQPDGWLTLEGLQSGNHHVRVSREGFQDWENNLLCDGQPKQIVAELKAAHDQGDINAIPRPTFQTMPGFALSGNQETPQQSLAASAGSQTANQMSPQNTWQTSMPQSVGTESIPPQKSSFFSPLILSVIGISGLLLLAIVSAGGLFALGIIGNTDGNVNASNNDIVILPNNTNKEQQPVSQNKSEMVKIPGGKFRMGRNDGLPIEQPEHEVDVEDFWIDKTEVTVAEYLDFVKATNYQPAPAYWERGTPLPGTENQPVRFVNMTDIEAFIKWRSGRDGVAYRLPTEAEWEYAARNGNDNNLYPWGDKFEKSCAVMDKPDTEPEPVGSRKCGENKWGVLDLMGNVYEWTGTRTALYPGNSGEVKEQFKGITNVIRGGSAFDKSSGKSAVTSTFRGFVELTKRDARLGFRLARSAE